jgi:hypothetical protein
MLDDRGRIVTHTLSAIIAPSDRIDRVRARITIDVAHASLAQGFAMLRLVRPLRSSSPPAHAGVPAGFYDLWQVAELLTATSTHGPIAYVETEYFGGLGDQGAAVYRDGSLVYAVGMSDLDDPRHGGFGNINGALRLLGVEAQDGEDEIDSVGLNHRR